MHSIVLLTAMTATTGLFGGHRQARTACQGGQCARPAAVAYAPATCRTGNCPTAYAAPVQAAAYAPAAPAMTYRSAYYPPAANCATGNCPRR